MGAAVWAVARVEGVVLEAVAKEVMAEVVRAVAEEGAEGKGGDRVEAAGAGTVVVAVLAMVEEVALVAAAVMAVHPHRRRSPRHIHRHLAPTPPPPPLLPPRRQGPCTTFTCTSRHGATSCGPP